MISTDYSKARFQFLFNLQLGPSIDCLVQTLLNVRTNGHDWPGNQPTFRHFYRPTRTNRGVNIRRKDPFKKAKQASTPPCRCRVLSEKLGPVVKRDIAEERGEEEICDQSWNAARRRKWWESRRKRMKWKRQDDWRRAERKGTAKATI